jgi:NAD(P)-dependent dehydrogenase (short-subunit alcohol dehydrogenase family)
MQETDMSWQLEDLPEQHGRTVIITGGNSGIGYEAARALAVKGARVIIACRDNAKAQAASDRITAESTSAAVATMTLDLASMTSVQTCADALIAQYEQIDVLINNAGVMAIPRRETKDGFEMQLGVNHLGHFALTARLFERIKSTPGSRIVNVSSLAHLFGFINLANLHGRMFYDPWAAYGQSKLANLLFTFELERRSRDAGLAVQALACHPGIAATNLASAGPRMAGLPVPEALVQSLTAVVAQSAAAGALPTLYAGFAEQATGGDYIGPDGIGETRGSPRKVQPSLMARSQTLARQLWQASEDATQITFDFSAPAPRPT